MTKDEALKMAIEALEMHVPHYIKDRGCEAIQACKEALEQPAWKPISLDEMQELHEDFGVKARCIFAIEDMLKEKNT